MFVLRRGVVAISRGLEEVRHYLTRGGFFGEICLVYPERHRTATVTAVSPCELAAIHKADYDEVCLVSFHSRLLLPTSGCFGVCVGLVCMSTMLRVPAPQVVAMFPKFASVMQRVANVHLKYDEDNAAAEDMDFADKLARVARRASVIDAVDKVTEMVKRIEEHAATPQEPHQNEHGATPVVGADCSGAAARYAHRLPGQLSPNHARSQPADVDDEAGPLLPVGASALSVPGEDDRPTRAHRETTPEPSRLDGTGGSLDTGVGVGVGVGGRTGAPQPSVGEPQSGFAVHREAGAGGASSGRSTPADDEAVPTFYSASGRSLHGFTVEARMLQSRSFHLSTRFNGVAKSSSRQLSTLHPNPAQAQQHTEASRIPPAQRFRRCVLLLAELWCCRADVTSCGGARSVL